MFKPGRAKEEQIIIITIFRCHYGNRKKAVSSAIFYTKLEIDAKNETGTSVPMRIHPIAFFRWN